MKKKLTLNQAWSKCLRMWKWVAANWEPGIDVRALKAEWLKLHEPKNKNIDNDCYFCEYDEQQDKGGSCKFCPGKLVSKYFYCWRPFYDWQHKPKAFYKKLLALNAKRKVKK